MATIRVYGRIVPCSNPTSLVEIQGDRLVTNSKFGRRNSQKNAMDLGFKFTEIFNQDATQGEVFDRIAKDVILKFLEGYNGTIFAYGQTGTGKTYTVEGEELNLDISPRHGLIPQALAMIFNEIDKMKGECVTVQISFLEIYNEMAYDLLGPLMYSSSNKRDLPRVLVTHGTSGSCTLHGLSIHDVCTEHDARRLHLKGRCNRTVAWMAGNERSSRSHGIFTVLLTRQKQDSEIVVKSKLNLVDLAGSERLSKSNTEGNTFYETKCINLSLHYLETVILALQKIHVQGTRPPLSKTLSRDELKPKRCKSALILENETLSNSMNFSGWGALKSAQSTLNVSEVKRKGISLGSECLHIPYRNSLLTMILQDSLGGNCNTTMISTLSLDTKDLNETISTCRFAQRVARVTNNPVQNKEINEAVLIKKLRCKVAKLVKDLADVQQNKREHLNSPTEESETTVIEVVNGYIQGRIVDPTACGIDNPQKVRACLAYLKGLLIHRSTRQHDEPTSSDEKDSGVEMNCDPLLTTSNNEEEPGTPSIVTDSGATSEESIPSPPSITNMETVKKQRRDAQLKNPSFNSSTQKFFPEIKSNEKHPESIAAEQTANCSPGSQVNTNSESRSTKDKVFGETEKQLLLLELEIKKKHLIQKSKLMNTALSNQKARIFVMEKHGCPVDELDNERLAEQQLRRKQAEVESHLSKTMKEILATKATQCVSPSVSRDKTADQNVDVSGIDCQVYESEIDAQVYRRRRLELKESFTRLRLLTCREKLDRGLMSTGFPPKVVSKETESKRPELCIDEANIRDARPLNSSVESSSSKPPSASSRNERPPSDVRPRGRLPSATACAQSSRSRRGTVTDNKRKSKFGVFNFRSGSSRQSRNLQGNSPRTSRRSHVNNSSQSYALHSNVQTNRQFRMSPRNSPTNSLTGGNQVENKANGKCLDRARLIRPVGNNPYSLQRVEGVDIEPVSVRSRRPAMCSPALMTSKRSMKRTTRPVSSNIHYQYDQSEGFIVRTNQNVYRASNFRQPVPQDLDIQILNLKRNVSEQSSPKSSSLSPNVEQGLKQYDDVTSTSYDTRELPAIVPKVLKEEDEPIGSHLQRTQIEPERENKGNLNGPQCDTPKKPLNDDEPKRNLMAQRVVPPTIISARKQQAERARRIRRVTNAVQVIQKAYRHYLYRKTKAISAEIG